MKYGVVNRLFTVVRVVPSVYVNVHGGVPVRFIFSLTVSSLQIVSPLRSTNVPVGKG
jgi:hypothetical protein